MEDAGEGTRKDILTPRNSLCKGTGQERSSLGTVVVEEDRPGSNHEGFANQTKAPWSFDFMLEEIRSQ